jgi:hypothetical protein
MNSEGFQRASRLRVKVVMRESDTSRLYRGIKKRLRCSALLQYYYGVQCLPNLVGLARTIGTVNHVSFGLSAVILFSIRDDFHGASEVREAW